MHMVDDTLIKAWRYHLTTREKYLLWFILFTTGERVRLWNRLVFTRDWFRRTINFSRRQAGNSKLISQQDDEEGLVRSDILYMLRVLARRMFDEGVFNEELLL